MTESCIGPMATSIIEDRKNEGDLLSALLPPCEFELKRRRPRPPTIEVALLKDRLPWSDNGSISGTASPKASRRLEIEWAIALSAAEERL